MVTIEVDAASAAERPIRTLTPRSLLFRVRNHRESISTVIDRRVRFCFPNVLRIRRGTGEFRGKIRQSDGQYSFSLESNHRRGKTREPDGAGNERESTAGCFPDRVGL